jgi:hypothetical protein
MQPSGVLSPFPNASNPPLRCRHNNLTDRLRRSDGCCQNYASWSDTSAALLRSETERFSTLLIKNSGCNLRLRTRKTKPIFLHLFNGLRNGRTRGPESARQSPPVLAAHTLWHRPALGDSSATASLMRRLPWLAAIVPGGTVQQRAGARDRLPRAGSSRKLIRCETRSSMITFASARERKHSTTQTRIAKLAPLTPNS